MSYSWGTFDSWEAQFTFGCHCVLYLTCKYLKLKYIGTKPLSKYEFMITVSAFFFFFSFNHIISRYFDHFQPSHQSFATPATLGPEKCHGLWGFSTVILPSRCPSRLVLWLCGAFEYPPNIDGGSSRLNSFESAGAVSRYFTSNNYYYLSPLDTAVMR